MISKEKTTFIGVSSSRFCSTGAAFRIKIASIMAVIALASLLSPSAAQAEFGIAAFDAQVTAAPPANPGDAAPAYTQAGGHPYEASTTFRMNTAGIGPDGYPLPDGNVRNVRVDLPAGFLGDPTVGPKCTEDLLEAHLCPASTQVGFVRADIPANGNRNQGAGLYNMEPRNGALAEFGFIILGKAIGHLVPRVRNNGDFGLTVESNGTPQSLPLNEVEVTLWGVPSDPRHDRLRYRGPTQCFDDPNFYPIFGPGMICTANLLSPTGGTPSDLPTKPFVTNPMVCSAGALPTTLTVDSWQNPGVTRTSTVMSHLPPGYPEAPQRWGAPQGVTDCGKLQFNPTLDVHVEPADADAPTTLNVALDFPLEGLQQPTGLAAPPLKKAVVALPEGTSVNPASVDQLKACTDAEIGIRVTDTVGCPGASKIGAVVATSPVLERELSGSIYLGTQNSLDPESGDMFRIFLVLENRERGLLIKLPGRIRASLDGRRLTTTFDDNPQLPVSNITLRFNAGPRAPIALPRSCGPQTTTAELTSWAGNVANISDSFNIPCPGTAPFAPGFTAGTSNPIGGADATFVSRFSREDKQPYLKDVAMDLPLGLTARIASADLCGEGDAAAGTCGAGSLIGKVTTGAGAGSQPFFLPGRVYVTGPYKGAPFGLSIVVPAVAGPFNLGTVVVRAAIFVDRNTARIRIVSDPMPEVLLGVPLRIRLVDISVDRPRFMVNPTNCAPQRVEARIGSYSGDVAGVAARFGVANCATLPYKPRMSLKLGARGRTRAGLTTPLQVTLDMPRGHAANKSVEVTLPEMLNSRLEVVNRNRACTIEQFRADRCPMQVGTAVAVTPLLRDPLRGPAYFVFNPDRRLPDLVVRLHGQVDFDLVGKVRVQRDLTLRTTFDTVPDVPITRFRLNLVSGRNGPIGTIRNLCAAATRRAAVARLAFKAQSGRTFRQNKRVTIAGCRATVRPRRGSSRRGARRSR